MHPTILGFLAACLLFALGCAKAAAPIFTPEPPTPPPSPLAPASMPADSGSSSGRVALGNTDRVLIYRAELALTVLDVGEALAQAQRTAEELGGYLQAIDDASIHLRIPAASFEDALFGNVDAMADQRGVAQSWLGSYRAR